MLIDDSELGKKSAYTPHYAPDILFAIPRKVKRDEINIDSFALPFYGMDIWNHYEVSWLNAKGKPMAAMAKMAYSCHSPNIIESKSMKLYFNSFNNTRFNHHDEIFNVIKRDLSMRVQSEVWVKLTLLGEMNKEMIYPAFSGVCLDHLDIECDTYHVEPSFLTVEQYDAEEVVYSDLLKSNCLVTHQPDWGSVQISYKGKKINHEGLLKYLVSFRNHNEFHEQCIERIYMDIMRRCQPTELTVYGRYTRRGGVDINPYRSSKSVSLCLEQQRLCRQ